MSAHSSRYNRIIPLTLLPDGGKGIVRKITGGFGVRRRLYELGFTEGTEVYVLKSAGPGPVLLLVRGSRLALGRGVAMKILVEVVT